MTSPANPTPNHIRIDEYGDAQTTLTIDPGTVLCMPVPAHIAEDPIIDYPRDGLSVNTMITMIDKEFKTDDNVLTSKLYFDETHACFESLSMEQGSPGEKLAYVVKLTFKNGGTLELKKSFQWGFPKRQDLVDASLTFPELRLEVDAMLDLLRLSTGDELISKTPQQLPKM